MNTTMPGDAEAAAAAAHLHEQTISPQRIAPGIRVRCPKAFGGGYQEGVVFCREDDATWLVDTPEGRLVLFREELEVI